MRVHQSPACRLKRRNTSSTPALPLGDGGTQASNIARQGSDGRAAAPLEKPANPPCAAPGIVRCNADCQASQ
ncbi:hypothetical protein BEN78_00795 [Xanthomonas citri pv. mangiferaeindicae]|nr:hypothetical protein BEN78_00795 [Xanthomonas citri pv. mangiferaeindicae]